MGKCLHTFTYYRGLALTKLIIAKPPRFKKVGDTNEGILSSFITHLEQAKYEKGMKKGNEMEVPEDSVTMKTFLHRSEPF